MQVNSTVEASRIDVNFSQPVSRDSSILTEIYKPKYNISIWQRRLPKVMTEGINEMLEVSKPLALVKSVTPENVAEYIRSKLSDADCSVALSEDIALIVDMFCCLFGVKEAGLRLTTLDKAMCPKFHVDQIPCRLVTTYTDIATQWLENKDIDLTQSGNTGISKDLLGLQDKELTIKQMNAGDIALLKGSGWQGNESMGLVHRSPMLELNEKRLLLTLDLI